MVVVKNISWVDEDIRFISKKKIHSELYGKIYFYSIRLCPKKNLEK